MIYRNSASYGVIAIMLAATASTAAFAGPRGSEFDATIMPAGGGMEGVAAARSPGVLESLFTNPATLTQMRGTNEFTFGAAFVGPNLRAQGPATDLFGGPPNMAPLTGPFSAKSRNTLVAAPHAAFAQRINERLVLATGFTAISGLGGDFRNEAGLPNLISDLKVFGANAGFGYQASDRLSIGAAMTLGIGALEIGLTDSSGVVNDFGFGGSVGLTYDLGPVVFGAAYELPLSITYNDVLEVTPNQFDDLKIQQPQEVILGLGTSEAVSPDWHLALEFRYKNYGGASTYQDVWKDLYIYSIAGQRAFPVGHNELTLRAGYSYTSRIGAETPGATFGGFTTVAAPDGSGPLPVTPTFMQLAQATIANGHWRQSVSAGAGYTVSNVRFDVHFNYAFDGDASFGPFTSNGDIYSLGMGITWNFGD